MAVELLLSNADRTKFYAPVCEEGIEWATKRRGEPGRLTFKVLQDGILDIDEGAEVRFTEDKNPVFFGFIFKRSRAKDGMVSVTAYDQIRYLKNQDTKYYEGKKAGELLMMLAEDYQLKTGEIEDTKYVIPHRRESGKSLLEMMENALDLTLQNSGELYVLFDDFGKLSLKNIANRKVGSGDTYLCINMETGQDYEYTTSIDDGTYNQVKLYYKNEDTGKNDIYLAKSGDSINRWGLLQYFDELKEGENGQAKADALLSLYNAKTKKLKLKEVLGDSRVRAGSMVIVNMKLDDTNIANFMLVEECSHTWKEGEHWMDLTLRGGGFSG